MRVLQILFALLFSQGLSAQSYKETYPSHFNKAIQFYLDHKVEWEKYFTEKNIDPIKAFCVVAPEISSYSAYQDKAETLAVQLFYIEIGRGYDDFSIGLYQMKPSFVELLEAECQRLGLITEFPELGYLSEIEKQKREERIKRITDPLFSRHYLALFFKVLHERSGEIDDVMMLATAYNSGFNKDVLYWKQMSQQAYFPRYSSRKFPYGKIAIEFYEAIKNL